MLNHRNVSYDKDFRPFTPFRATLLGRPFRVHCGGGQQGNRITNPSFRRKPESRTLVAGSFFSGRISWIPAFAGTTVKLV